MALTSEQLLQFSNEWSQSQIDDFARRLVAAIDQTTRQAILAEFKANLPNPEFDQHPQFVELAMATRFPSTWGASYWGAP